MEKKLETHTFIFVIVVGNLGFGTKWTINIRQDLLRLDLLLLLLETQWVIITRNWRLVIGWAWNLGHATIWNIIVVKNLWLAIGWIGNLRLIIS